MFLQIEVDDNYKYNNIKIYCLTARKSGMELEMNMKQKSPCQLQIPRLNTSQSCANIVYSDELAHTASNKTKIFCILKYAYFSDGFYVLSYN